MGEREAEKMSLSQYTIHAFWDARLEAPEALAIRFNRLIDRLSSIDAVFGNWYWCANWRTVAFEPLRSSLAKEIAAAVSRNEWGDPEPIYGYHLLVCNSLEDTPRSISVSISGGSPHAGVGYSNYAVIETAWRMSPDPAIVAYPVIRAALLALAETFEVTFSTAYPADLWDLPGTNQFFRIGWITYVSPRFAPLINPPPTAIVERRPNGGLLMSATDETFVTANPRHLAIARDIETAVAPLNALPWPPDAEPG
jgi:hypothetical protein